MNLFHGVHEVRLLRPSSVAVGYFDSWDAALRAIENEPPYKAAYFSLNPVRLPEGFQAPVNPPSLTLTSNTASDADIERRVWLLVDLDPERPAGTNSTEAEKQLAHEQAEQVREYLKHRGWPAPLLCDSGTAGICSIMWSCPTMTTQRRWCARCWPGSNSASRLLTLRITTQAASAKPTAHGRGRVSTPKSARGGAPQSWTPRRQPRCQWSC